jgi:3-hydroxybutyryl-CoA dehydratase
MLELFNFYKEKTVMPEISTSKGLYFEEFEIGHSFRSPARTITETDIVNFAGMSGDFTSIHTDKVYSENSFFGRRVAHGLLVLSIASGLAARAGVLEGTVIAFREISTWKFSKPVFIGDTVHVDLTVAEKKLMPRLDGGAVVLEAKVQNQDDETVMKGKWHVLVQTRPAND